MTDPRGRDGGPSLAAAAALDPQELRRVGLCARCTNARRITSAKGSTFWMCSAPGLPKYPPLPVVRCVAFAPAPSPG